MFCAGCREFVSEVDIKRATNGHTSDVPGRLGPVVVTLADVEAREVEWLWRGRLAVGRITVLMGDPGAGKSFAALAIATALSVGGKLPGEPTALDPADVLVLGAEDGLEDTCRPRCEAMGANLHRIHYLTAVVGLDGKERHPSLIDHLAHLERALVEHKIRLLILDPINAFLGSQLDTHRDAALRSALAPLAALCDRLGVACIIILHLTKGSRDRALYRGNGSIGYSAAARVVLLAGQDPEDAQTRAICWVKGNLTEEMPSIGYSLSEGVFFWTGESELTKERILAPDSESGKVSALAEAKDFLMEVLSDGSQPSLNVEKDARAGGIAKRTLDRARRELGVRAIPIRLVGKAGVQSWTWALPEGVEGLDCQGCHTENLATLTPFVSESGPVAAEVGNLNPGPLGRDGVGLGLAVNGRSPAFNLCGDDDANPLDDFRKVVTA